jgi:hypothetical protein
MVLAIAATAAPARADTEVGSGEMSATATASASADTEEADADETDGDAALESYRRNERALYDALTTDPSPRVQVLAGRVYVDDDATPSALRPKRDDVVTRAAQLAPDDAFVQWMAASSGSYASSSCGPTKWPETEVANLLGLEPDNVAAWQFGVALARAKGNEAGVDDALSRMAAARRTDDHLIEEIAAWTSVFGAHPELVDSSMMPYQDANLTQQEKAMLAAQQRVDFDDLTAESALKTVCTPDANSDRTWQRLGWCADVGRQLAEKGGSLRLRKEGLALLETIGDQSEATASWKRQYDWFEANGANPMQHFDPAGLSASVADWNGATSETAAIEHRLKRLGLPSTPPATWTKEPDHSAGDDAETAKAIKQYADYMSAVFADMRASSSPEQRVVAALNENVFEAIVAAAKDGSEPMVDRKHGGDAIAALAEANAGNIRIQWMIAGASGQYIPVETKATAIATVQQAEDDNAAAWALSLELPSAATDELADTLLQRMAASSRFDFHMMYGVSAFLEALRQRPAPPEMMASFAAKMGGEKMSADLAAKVSALSMAYGSTTIAPIGVTRACKPSKDAAMKPSRRDACIAVGRLLMQKAPTLIAMRFGESILRQLDALDAADSERTRRVMWWKSMSNPDDTTYVAEFIASGNEIDALRHYAESRGKAEPPADWKPRRGNATH